ncbi:MAG: efflux transporter outer membrane subunit [Methylibium sp.]|nr:efflux transporter outer membrane subunit [Methylibium sp.]
MLERRVRSASFASGAVAQSGLRAWITPRAPVLAALAVLILAGCAAVGPDYQRPVPVLDAGGFINAGAPSANRAEPSADIAVFWRGFGDAALSALVERALEANGDVRIAQARLQEARANQGEADALGRPGVGLTAGATRSVQPVTQLPGQSRSERTGTIWDAGFIANWELDFFGRYRRLSESAAAVVEASVAGLAAAHTAVAAETARNYLELRGLQQRLRFTEESLASQRETLRLTELRLDAGRGTRLDVARARALTENTEAGVPALQSAIELTVFRLATLTAQPPRTVLESLQTPAPLPGLPVTDLAALPLGTPEAWLARRPDIIAAERSLAAATANIGVATSDLFPRISLSGLLGLNAATLGRLGNSDSAVYSLGAGVSWTPLDFGLLRSRIRATEARAQQSLASYEQTLALALEETEVALSGYNRNAQRAARLDRAARSAEQAAVLARLRFDAGYSDFLAVLDAEREVLLNRDQLVQAQTGTAMALIGVYRALGGGWAAPAAAAGTTVSSVR